MFGSKNYASAGYALSNTEIKIVDTDLNNLGPDEVSVQTFIVIGTDHIPESVSDKCK